ncbi:MAG TPA: hypothetical protein VF195_02605 [Actinomycetota bacterium]
MSEPDGTTTSPDLPIVGLTNNQVTDLGVKLDPEKAARETKAIRDAFLKVLDRPAGASACRSMSSEGFPFHGFPRALGPVTSVPTQVG